MYTANCDRHWLKNLARVVAVNCVAGAIPAAFLLMIDSHVKRGDVVQSLIAGAVFANAIGIPCNYLLPRLYPHVARRGTVREWIGVTLSLDWPGRHRLPDRDRRDCRVGDVSLAGILDGGSPRFRDLHLYHAGFRIGLDGIRPDAGTAASTGTGTPARHQSGDRSAIGVARIAHPSALFVQYAEFDLGADSGGSGTRGTADGAHGGAAAFFAGCACARAGAARPGNEDRAGLPGDRAGEAGVTAALSGGDSR